jgi:hypothetical protein
VIIAARTDVPGEYAARFESSDKEVPDLAGNQVQPTAESDQFCGTACKTLILDSPQPRLDSNASASATLSRSIIILRQQKSSKTTFDNNIRCRTLSRRSKAVERAAEDPFPPPCRNGDSSSQTIWRSRSEKPPLRANLGNCLPRELRLGDNRMVGISCFGLPRRSTISNSAQMGRRVLLLYRHLVPGSRYVEHPVDSVQAAATGWISAMHSAMK